MNKIQQPILFSVITVCFNSSKTVEACLSSVEIQSFKNFEHLVIDGKSNDGTMEILEKHQQHLSVLVHEKDHGIYDAMNKGLKLARGTYTLFLNADDQFANAKVLEQLSKYTQSNSAILGTVRIFKANKLYRVYSAKHFKPWMFIFGHQPPHPGFVCKTELLRSAGGFDASYKISGDFELMLKLFNTKNFSWHTIPLTITHMQHGGASSGSFSKKAAMNKENYKALKQNNKLAFGPFIWMKYALKIFQIRW